MIETRVEIEDSSLELYQKIEEVDQDPGLDLAPV